MSACSARAIAEALLCACGANEFADGAGDAGGGLGVGLVVAGGAGHAAFHEFRNMHHHRDSLGTAVVKARVHSQRECGRLGRRMSQLPVAVISDHSPLDADLELVTNSVCAKGASTMSLLVYTELSTIVHIQCKVDVAVTCA